MLLFAGLIGTPVIHYLLKQHPDHIADWSMLTLGELLDFFLQVGGDANCECRNAVLHDTTVYYAVLRHVNKKK